MTLATALSSQVPAQIRDRGRECFNSGIVIIDDINTREVLATIEGKEDCDVDLTLEATDPLEQNAASLRSSVDRRL